MPSRLPAWVAATAAFAVPSANAADLAGKWYGKLDSEPVITIANAGAAYSASLDYPDITKSVQRPMDTHPFQETIHKELASFGVSGNALHFIIRNIISFNGDTDISRDEYSLTLSGDQLTGTVRHIGLRDPGLTGHSVPQSVTPITLFPSDWNSRNTNAQP